jgi:predicted murein hydrolase (TIGR00659 family)
MSEFGDVWVYLSASPLLWLTLTLIAYLIGHRLHVAAGGRPYVNPVAIAIALLIALLLATGTPYDAYFEGAQFVHFLLGPTVVAIAVPLRREIARVRRALLPMLAALVLGSVTAVGSAVAIASLLGARPETIASIAAKSVTSPIAMGIAEQMGGLPSLAAVMVLLTGMFGASIVTPLFDALGIRDWRARGFAAGVAAHGLGTARAFQVDALAGIFAGIAMGLNGVLTALIVPLVLTFWR